MPRSAAYGHPAVSAATTICRRPHPDSKHVLCRPRPSCMVAQYRSGIYSHAVYGPSHRIECHQPEDSLTRKAVLDRVIVYKLARTLQDVLHEHKAPIQIWSCRTTGIYSNFLSAGCLHAQFMAMILRPQRSSIAVGLVVLMRDIPRRGPQETS